VIQLIQQYVRTGESSDGFCRPLGKVKTACVVEVDKTTGQKRGYGLAEMESRNDNHRVIVALHRNQLDEATLRCCSIVFHSRFPPVGSNVRGTQSKGCGA
jgi:hypothetical protein